MRGFNKRELVFSVFKRIFAAPSVKELMLFKSEDAGFNSEPIKRGRLWHRAMQGQDFAITPGGQPASLKYLHTSFDQSDEEIAASERVRRDELCAARFEQKRDRRLEWYRY